MFSRGMAVTRPAGRTLVIALATIAVVAIAVGGIGVPSGQAAAQGLVLGANFNENLGAVRIPTLEAARVRWIRGFLPAFEFIDGPRRLETDDRVHTLRAAAAAGYKTVLSLKWNFRQQQLAVPSPGSDREQKCFAWAVETTKFCKPDLLCLVNESLIDTTDADLIPDGKGHIAFVVFMQRLAAHVKAAHLPAPDGSPLPVASGGFTRLYDPKTQSQPAVVALLRWLAETDTVDVVDFHIHHSTMPEMEQALRFVRRYVKGKPLIVTEFSRVWAYGAHRNSAIGASEKGREFALRHGLDPTMTVQEYISSCFANPVSEAQYHDFLSSQSWFDPQYLEQACDSMQRYGVVLATYAFVQEASGGKRPPGKKAALWCLNPVFADVVTVSPVPSRPGVSTDFFNTFVTHQEGNPSQLLQLKLR